MQPLQLAIVLDQSNLNIFTLQSSLYGCYCINIHEIWNTVAVNQLFNDVLTADSYLTECSSWNPTTNIDDINSSVVYYLFFLNYTKNKLLLLINVKQHRLPSIQTIEPLFLNSSWLEREMSEMYGIIFLNKNDSRKLLLMYSVTEHPMHKSFPCSGYNESYYSVFEQQVVSVQTSLIEL